MKKIYLFILVLNCVLVNAQKQKHTDRYYNSWRLGLNVGGMWQTSDVKRGSAGAGAGFTLEKAFHENATNFFSFAIKGRGLWGNTYGLDYARNYNILNDPSLNGKYNPGANYDSVAATGGAPFIYNNYKTKIAEGSLELQVCFNRLREQTNVLLNLWGGIGFTSYRTKVNLLNNKNQMYNYLLVDSSGSQASVLSSHRFLLDDTYESNGNNSQNGNVLTWSPSCGIGLGYRFNDHISLIWEYKVTFPQGAYADYLDGIEKHNNDWIGCNKDYYHYTGLNMTIRLGGKSGRTQSTTDVNNYSNATTNTVVTTNPTNSVITTNSVVTNPINTVTTTPVGIKPIVNITNPPSSPYTETANRNFTINATIQHVNIRSQVYITFNGVEVKNYTWLGRFISFTESLNVGDNVISVTATNNAGSDSKSAVVVYSGAPPQITITTPGANKFTSTESNSDVFATILNVPGPQNISVKLNGQPFSTFSYNPMDKVFGMNAALITGTNTVDIYATNDFGQDTKTQILIYKPAAVLNSTVVAAKPVTVVITDPPVNPYKANGAIYNVKSTVTGVTTQNQVTVTVNSNVIPFTYVGGNVNFNVSLSAGTNLIQVSARNGRQSDSKTTVITYEGPKKITPPTVVIINPNPSPYTTTGNTYPFKAQTTYINDKTQLEVKYNGTIISNYTFDATTGFIDYNANLTLNSNDVFEVKATNNYGNASASAIVKQEQPKTKIICHRVDRGTMQTMTILESDWATHQAHGDYEGPCQKSEDPQPDPAITICHKNADGSKQTISILQSQWPTHQAHGDVMGACPKVQNETPLDNDITICHMNADGSKQTIVIKESTWPSHQAHGDFKGVCPKVSNETPLDNDITICHMNADGSKQTIVIKESTWPTHQAHGDVKGTCPKVSSSETLDPDMEICHKNNDGSVVKMTIKTSQWPAHQAHGDFVGGNCTVNTNTATSSTTVQICHNNGDGTKTTIVIPLDQFSAHRAHGDIMGECAAVTNTVPTNNGITICHNNGDGSKTTMIIAADQWGAHRAHGDALGNCPPEDKKITICHIPPGNNQNPQTIEINESAWPAHQAHGDTKGACAVEDKKITICHIPPGNNQNPQTIEINESAWPAHQAHGDTKGACPEQKTTEPQKGGGKNNGNENGTISPGRTAQPTETTTEPQKTTQEPQKTETIKMKPR
jgi:hypothetical protein